MLTITRPNPQLIKTLGTVARFGHRLCGSRHFHELDPDLIPITNETDWDYCGEYSLDAVSLLSANGFDTTTNLDHEYTDDSARMVLTNHNCTPQVQVVLRTNVDEYLSILNSITPEYFNEFLWKSGPNHPTPAQIKATINQLMATHKVGQKYAWSEAARYTAEKS